MQKKDPRDYGLGDPTQYIDGPPRLASLVPAEGECPICKGRGTMFVIHIPIKGMPMLRGGVGTGVYFGCAACPYASPMMTVAKGEEKCVTTQ